MAKLHVPPPEGADDRSDVNLAMMASVFLLLVVGLLMVRAAEQRTEDLAKAQPPAEVPRDIYDDLADQRVLAAQIGKLDDAALAARTWTPEDQQAVLRFGPREATELVCQQSADAIRDDSLPKQLRLELEKTLDRRTEFAPWTCMMRLFLDRAIPAGPLYNEMKEYADEISRHQGKERIPISVLEDFRKNRERPDNPTFYAWLRLCALDFDYQPHVECQKLLYQMAPDQGADMLQMIELHWNESGTKLADMKMIIRGLGHLARNGQPHSWKVKETDALPDYDVEFRQAAVGYLCRMMHTPTSAERGTTEELDPVPELAGEQLGKTGLVGARAYEEKLLMRWREACRIALGGGYNEDRTEFTPVPILGVWDGDPQTSTDYRIASAIKLGTCRYRDEYPMWHCLADAWKDEERTLDAALAHAFVQTRYMMWEDAWDTPAPPDPVAKEPKPEPKQEPVKETKPEPKPQPKPESKPQPKPEPVQQEPKPEPKPEEEAKPEAAPDPAPAAPQPEAEEAEPEGEPEP